MNLFDFNRKIFRRPEGEDGGGYSDAGTSAGDPPAAEQDDKFSRLEARLERLDKIVILHWFPENAVHRISGDLL